MRAIITKYSTSSGPFVIDFVLVKDTTSMIEKLKEPGTLTEYFHGKDWHTDKQSAINDVRKRFEKRRASLSKELSKLSGKMQSALAAIESAEL